MSAAAKVSTGPNTGDYVACWSNVKIKTKSGKELELPMNSIFRIENGKINIIRLLFNEGDTLRQLGYKIEAPAAAMPAK